MKFILPLSITSFALASCSQNVIHENTGNNDAIKHSQSNAFGHFDTISMLQSRDKNLIIVALWNIKSETSIKHSIDVHKPYSMEKEKLQQLIASLRKFNTTEYQVLNDKVRERLMLSSPSYNTSNQHWGEWGEGRDENVDLLPAR